MKVETGSIKRCASHVTRGRVVGILLFLFLLAFSHQVRAQASAISSQVQNTFGVPVPYATVRICAYTSSGVPCNPVATIYSDPGLTHAIPNPTTANQYGFFSVFVSNSVQFYIVQEIPNPGITYIYYANGGNGSGGGFTPGLDLSGSSTSQEVIGILGHTLPSLATGCPYWSGSAWAFESACATGTPGGSPTQVQYNNTAFGGIPGSSVNTSTGQTTFAGNIETVGTTTNIGSVTFTGSGLNDLTTGGANVCLGSNNFTVTITATGTPDTFKWTDSQGVVFTGLPVSTFSTSIACGISIKWASSTGHTIGDHWSFTATGSQPYAPFQVTGPDSNPSFVVNADGSISGNGILVNGVDSPSRQNTSVGFGNMHGATSASDETAFGWYALFSDVSGLANTAVGWRSQMSNTAASDNSSLGVNSLESLTTGLGNTAVGWQALLSATTPNLNTAVGYQAAAADTTGAVNTAVGASAMITVTTGSYNTAFGGSSLSGITSGSYNVALGNLALGGDVTGSSNVAIGNGAGENETGSDQFYLNNIAQTGVANDRAYSLLWGTFSGVAGSLANQQLTVNGNFTVSSLGSSTSPVCPNGVNNSLTTIGCTSAGSGTQVQINGTSESTVNMTGTIPLTCKDTSGSGTSQTCTTTPSFTLAANNCVTYSTTTANGTTALTVSINGTSASIAVPSGMGWTTTLSTSPASMPANKPIQLCYDGANLDVTQNGVSASVLSVGLAGPAAFAITGSPVTTTGTLTFSWANTSSSLFLGYGTPTSITGGQDTVVGYQAAPSLTSATYETALGYLALDDDASGSDNTALGGEALEGITSAQQNTSVGFFSLGHQTSGNDNTAIGYFAGEWNSTGADNTFLGANSGPSSSASYSDSICIGYNCITTASNQTVIGTSSTTAATLYGAVTLPSLTTAGLVTTTSGGAIGSEAQATTGQGGTGQAWGSSSGIPELNAGVFSLYNSSCSGSTNALTWNSSTEAFGCNSITTSGVAISSLLAATTSNTIASGNNGAQVWNWALTSNSETAFTFGETTAATGTSDALLAVTTLAGSTAVPLTITSSITGSQTLPTLKILPTWNTTGVVDAGILENVTNSASGAGSLLIDLQVGGTSEFKVDKTGSMTANNVTDSALNTSGVVTNSSAGLLGTEAQVTTGQGGTGQAWGSSTGIPQILSGTFSLYSTSCALASDALQYSGGAFSCNTAITASSIPFSGITTATNTSATMTVGTGGTLTYSGTGTVNATAVESAGAITANATYYFPVISASSSGNYELNAVSGLTVNPSTGAVNIPGSLATGGLTNGISGGTAGLWAALEGTAPTAITGSGTFDLIYGDSTLHADKECADSTSSGIGTCYPVAVMPTTSTAGDLLSVTNSNGYQMSDSGVVAANVVTSGSAYAQYDVPYYSGSGTSRVLTGVAISGIQVDSTSAAPSAATSSTVITLWTGTCSSTTYLNGNGACTTPAGSGTINAGAQYDVTYYSGAGSSTTVSGAAVAGFVYGSASAAPAAATAAELGTLANIAQYDVVVSGGTSAALAGIAPSSTSGAIFASAGSSANPAYDANATVSAGALALGGSGTLGSIAMGNATSGVLTLEPATGAITSYTLELPVAQPSGSSTILSCTAANPSVCTWVSVGAGTVTSVTIAGTANQITASGTCTITSSGTCTLSLPNAVDLGTDNSAAGTLQLSNGSANAHTIISSVATTNNTVDFFATAPTNGDLIYAAVSGTTTTLTDAGYPYNAVPFTDLSGHATIAQGGTNATSAAAGTVPNATSSTVASWTATPTLGVSGTTTGTLDLASSGSGGSSTITPGTITAGYTETLPAATSTLSGQTTTVTTAGEAMSSTTTAGIEAAGDIWLREVIIAANCNNTTAGAGMSLPTSAAPTVVCRTGTNVQTGYLQFAASECAQFQDEIPGDWDSSNGPYVRVNYTQSGSTASQSIIFTIQSGASTTTDDPSFNTVQTFSTTTTGSTANTPYDQTLQLNSTSTTNWAAGNVANFKVCTASGSNGTPNLQTVTLTWPHKTPGVAGAN